MELRRDHAHQNSCYVQKPFNLLIWCYNTKEGFPPSPSFTRFCESRISSNKNSAVPLIKFTDITSRGRECIVGSAVLKGCTPKCWGGTVTGLARSDEPELSFLCFFCGLSGLDPLLSPSASISSGLAPSRDRITESLAQLRSNNIIQENNKQLILKCSFHDYRLKDQFTCTSWKIQGLRAHFLGHFLFCSKV